jgi:hypothetical protein
LTQKQKTGASDRATITGSRVADSTVFLMLATLAAVGSWRLRVYFRVTVAEVRATRTDTNGSSHEIELPLNFVRTRAATYPPEVLLNDLAARMESFTRDEAPASRTQWTVRYSYDSSRLDRVCVFDFPALR